MTRTGFERSGLTRAALAAVLAFAGCRGDGPEPDERGHGLAVGGILGVVEDSRYARATEPRPFLFPDDHGAHPQYRTEWWYFTGNLATAAGRRFGYELTIFRNALAPEMPERDSSWATRQVYLAHFALTDVDAGRFHASERLSRDSVGLAGARPQPFRLWLEDWSVAAVSTDATMPARIRAADGEVAIDLTVEPTKPLVAHGEQGLSAKGEGEGNASYYYSFTRLATAGTVVADGETHVVEGSSWMDHEWSTSALAEGQVGWDWFSLQLDDMTELMLFELRRADGTRSFASGSLVAADGSVRALAATDFTVEVLDRVRIEDAEYPSRWRLEVPDAGIDLTVVPRLADQELKLMVRYWEGSVQVTGSRGGRRVGGSGYVELTGYAGATGGRG